VYFLRNGQVWPVARRASATAADAGALGELDLGPTPAEKETLGLSTSVPVPKHAVNFELAGTRRVGVVRYQPSFPLGKLAKAQVVYTLTQFPTIKAVEIDGKRYTRTDFEDQTPPILVESPLSGEKVSSPIRVTGTANTFEATFQRELHGPRGNILSKHFEMATSGSGTRGTFAFEIPFKVLRGGTGKLVLYEDSAEDGSRIHVQEIPLELRR